MPEKGPLSKKNLITGNTMPNKGSVPKEKLVAKTFQMCEKKSIIGKNGHHMQKIAQEILNAQVNAKLSCKGHMRESGWRSINKCMC